jgi:hypothetical protein
MASISIQDMSLRQLDWCAACQIGYAARRGIPATREEMLAQKVPFEAFAVFMVFGEDNEPEWIDIPIRVTRCSWRRDSKEPKVTCDIEGEEVHPKQIYLDSAEAEIEADSWNNGAAENFWPTTDGNAFLFLMEQTPHFELKRLPNSPPDRCCQVTIHSESGLTVASGPTMPVAFARCFVESRCGDVVDVPAEVL